MPTKSWTDKIATFDERRNVAICGDKASTLTFCVEHFIGLAKEAIASRGAFNIALSGGSTPKKIFESLATEENREKIDWRHVHLFWSDERCVGAGHPDSNYKMAMDAGFTSLDLPEANIHRIQGEDNPNEAAANYQSLIERVVPNASLDLIMLGMGDDGHTASLFPKTQALHSGPGLLVVPNWIPEKECWRITFTYQLLQQAKEVAFYVLGDKKATVLDRVLNGPNEPDQLPSQRVGTPQAKALWIIDNEAAKLL